VQITLELTTILYVLGGLLSVQIGVGSFLLVQLDKVEKRARHNTNNKVMQVDQKLEKFIRDSDQRQHDHFQAMQQLRDTINDLTKAVGELTGKVATWSQPLP